MFMHLLAGVVSVSLLSTATAASLSGELPVASVGMRISDAVGDPRRNQDLFRTGMTALRFAERADSREIRSDRLDEAIASFHAILIDSPGLMRVRLELARAFFLKGEDALARRHFERVLAGKPPAGVVLNVNRFLDLMRARRRWSGYFGFAIAPDSNINAASSEEIIHLETPFGRLPFRRDAGARSGLGLSVWGGGEYAYPLTERLGIRAGGDASRREYEGSTFDRTFVGLHLGPRWLIGAASEVSLLAEVSRQWHSGNPDSDTFGGRIEAERRLGPRWRLDASAAWRKRDYRRHDYLDGPAREVSLGASWVATPTLRLWATLGHDRDRPKTKQWRSAALWGRLGASFVLPRGFTLGASGALRRTAYEGGDGGWPHYTDDGTRRTDMTRTLRVSVLNRGLTFAGFSPRLTLVDEMRTTNAQLQDYKRNRAELGFVKQF